MIKGQPKIGDKVVIRWTKDGYEHDSLDTYEIVTDGKRVFLRGINANNGKPVRAFSAAGHRTVASLIESIGHYQYDGIINRFYVRRTHDRRIESAYQKLMEMR